MENKIVQNMQEEQGNVKITAENIRSLVKFLQRTNLNPSEIDEFLNLIKIIQVLSLSIK